MPGIYWIASYPKSGNTWFRAYLRNHLDDRESPANINQLYTGFIASARRPLDEILGFDTADLTHAEVERLRPAFYRWSLQEDSYVGYHKIHDAYTLTDQGEPIISVEATLGALYIIRNPLDVAISAANHWGCSVDESIIRMGDAETVMCNSTVIITPQIQQRLGSWSSHVLSWVDAPDLNVHVIRYEDMLNDAVDTFSGASNFLELAHDRERVEKSIRHSSFEELSRQESDKGFVEKPGHAAQFFREGKSGGWRGKLTKDQYQRVINDHSEVMERFGYLSDASFI